MKIFKDANSFSSNLALWGVDRPPSDSEMLLNFVEKLVDQQNVPAIALTREELEIRRPILHRQLRHSLGLDPWPEKTPLNAKITGALEKSEYIIEKLVFEAWAGLQVTAHLYLPKNSKKPSAGLVYACGHWMEAGKLAPTVQSFCATAATLGIVTLVIDPIGQGERFESWRDHGHLNALLVGKTQIGLMVWESIRALDYLMTRPEVDHNKIGMTGASGGGLNTLFTTAIEDRFSCSIPVAYPCTFSEAMKAERDLNWEDGTDVCNQVPLVMSYAEMSDIASLFIPKPYMILSGVQDKIFPISGVRKIASSIKHNYELVGEPEKFKFVEFDVAHGYQLSLRETAYGWLKKWLLDLGDGSPISEPALDLIPNPYPVEYSAPPTPTPYNLSLQSPTLIPTDDSLTGFCLAPNFVLNNQRVIDSIIFNSVKKIPDSPPLSYTGSEFVHWQKIIRQSIQHILGPFPNKNILHTRLFNQVWQNDMMAERITFQSEVGISIPGLLIMPADWKQPVPFVIYAGEWGKMQGIQSGFIEDLVKSGFGVLAIDVRGVGETATTDFEVATNLLMMDRPLFGQRVFDVIRAIDFLWERCYIAPQIDKGRLVVAGTGVGGLWSLFAAAIDERVSAVVVQDAPYSYKCLLDHSSNYPASVYLFDVLNHFDLPDVISSCFPRPVYISPVDGYRRPYDQLLVDSLLNNIKETYSYAELPTNFFQVALSSDESRISMWLKTVLY